MKVTVDAQALREGLKFSTCRRSLIPGASHVRIGSLGPEDGEVELATTDLENTAWIHVPATIEEGGDIAVPERLLASVLQGLEGEVTITDGELRCSHGRFRLPTLGADEVPIPDEIPNGAKDLGLASAALAEALRGVKYATGKKDVRYYLNGVYIGPDYVGATDGHRVAMTNGIDTKASMIVPNTAIDKVLKVLDEGCAVKQQENHLVLEGAHITLACKLIDGKFPDCQSVVPGDDQLPNVARINVAPLKSALGRIKAIAEYEIEGTDKTPAVMLTAFEGNLSVTCGDSSEEVPLETLSGRLHTTLNARYLADVLNQTDETIDWLAKDDGALDVQVFIPGEHQRHAIMPVRL